MALSLFHISQREQKNTSLIQKKLTKHEKTSLRLRNKAREKYLEKGLMKSVVESIRRIKHNHVDYVSLYTQGKSHQGLIYFGNLNVPTAWMGKFPLIPDIHRDIYSDDYIDAIHDLCKKYEQIQWYISVELSRLMNGEKDIEGYTTLEQEKSIIYKNFKKNKRKGQQIHIVEIAELPQHAALFKVLRDYKRTDGNGVDIERAFSNEGPEPITKENISSLLIAKHLYALAKKSPRFYEHLLHAVPKQLHHKIEQVPSIPYYAMVEIAIRLYEMYKGNTMHMGTVKQYDYDHIINKILLEGYEEDSENVFDILKKKLNHSSWSNFYIDNKKNPHTLKNNRKIYRTKLGIKLGIVAILAMTYTYKAQKSYEHHQKVAIEQQEKKTAKVLDKKSNNTELLEYEGKFADMIKKHQSKLQETMSKRFCFSCSSPFFNFSEGKSQMTEQQEKDVQLLLRYYLEERPESVIRLEKESQYDKIFIDEFINRHFQYFETRGIQVSHYFDEFIPLIPTLKQLLNHESTVPFRISIPDPLREGAIQYFDPYMGPVFMKQYTYKDKEWMIVQYIRRFPERDIMSKFGLANIDWLEIAKSSSGGLLEPQKRNEILSQLLLEMEVYSTTKLPEKVVDFIDRDFDEGSVPLVYFEAHAEELENIPIIPYRDIVENMSYKIRLIRNPKDQYSYIPLAMKDGMSQYSSNLGRELFTKIQKSRRANSSYY